MKKAGIFMYFLAVILPLAFTACTGNGSQPTAGDSGINAGQPATCPADGPNGGTGTPPTADALPPDTGWIAGKWVYTHSTAKNDDTPYTIHEFQHSAPFLEINEVISPLIAWNETELSGNIRIALYESVYVGIVNLSGPDYYVITDLKAVAEGIPEHTDRVDYLYYNPNDGSMRYSIGGTDVHHHFARAEKTGTGTISIIPYKGHDAVEFSVEETELNLMHWDLTNEAIIPLKHMVNLTWLVMGTGVDDISPLKDLVNLKTLSLSGNKISGFNALEGLTNLIWLDLIDTGIENLDVLKGLTNLEVLTLNRNPLTQEQIDGLQEALPN